MWIVLSVIHCIVEPPQQQNLEKIAREKNHAKQNNSSASSFWCAYSLNFLSRATAANKNIEINKLNVTVERHEIATEKQIKIIIRNCLNWEVWERFKWVSVCVCVQTQKYRENYSIRITFFFCFDNLASIRSLFETEK